MKQELDTNDTVTTQRSSLQRVIKLQDIYPNLTDYAAIIKT